ARDRVRPNVPPRGGGVHAAHPANPLTSASPPPRGRLRRRLRRRPKRPNRLCRSAAKLIDRILLRALRRRLRRRPKRPNRLCRSAAKLIDRVLLRAISSVG